MPKTKIIYTAAETAAHLVAAGYPAKARWESDDLTDGNVEIGDGDSVQVGDGYLMLGKWDETAKTMAFSQAVVHPHEIVTQLHEQRRAS